MTKHTLRFTLPVLGLSVLGMAYAPAAIAAGCTQASYYQAEGGPSGWPARVENSAKKELRDAYDAGTCIYTKGEHGGGTIPDGAPSDKHITVKYSSTSASCHVFKKKSTLPAGAYNPTTCF